MITSEQILTEIDENLHNWTFSVEPLAEILHISPSFLRELTQQYFGKTPHQLIVSRRMKRTLILMPQVKHLYELYPLVGYNCMRTFRRDFTREFGMTPTMYRLKNNLLCA